MWVFFWMSLDILLCYTPAVQLRGKSVVMMSSERISSVVQGIAVSKTIEIHGLTKEMESRGERVLSLCVGEPDYQPPEEVMAALQAAAGAGTAAPTKYTAVAGESQLRSAIATDLQDRKGLSYAPTDVVVSSGAKQSVFQALMTVVDRGDRVIVPAPYWPSYPDMVTLCGASVVSVECNAANKYVLGATDLRRALESNPDVSAIILCNPSNPTGSVSSRQELESLAEVLRDYPHVTIISDEIYDQLVYDVEHVSFAALDGMHHRTITINGFSKSYSMTGFRVGYAAAPPALAAAMSKLQSQLTSCACSLSQASALAALEDVPTVWMSERREELSTKRLLAHGLLEAIPGVTCPVPDGAFYLLPDVSAYYGKRTAEGVLITDSVSLCLQLLSREKVALVPGDAFGAPRAIRVSYAASEELIRQTLSGLTVFLKSLE